MKTFINRCLFALTIEAMEPIPPCGNSGVSQSVRALALGDTKKASRWLSPILLACALFCHPGLQAAAATPPPVDVSVEPEENGRLVYLPIAAGNATLLPSNLFSLRLSVANTGANDVRLTGIRVTFTYPDQSVSGYQFVRDALISASATQTFYLEPKESIQLPEPAPSKVEIALLFDGYSAKTLERQLAAYQSPAPGGKYLFPGNASDLGPDTYFSHVDPHSGGDQLFGYDLHVQAWDGHQFSQVKADGDPHKNEDRVGWKIPIYAMADGVVIDAQNGYEDNPAPGKRVLQALASYTGETIQDVKVTQLTPNRAATVVRLPSGKLKIMVWDLEADGKVITQRGSTEGDIVEAVATDALSASRLVTALRTTGGNLKVIVWEISSDGTIVDQLGDETDVSGFEEISLVTLSASRFATAGRTQQGNLRVLVWQADASGTVSLLSAESAGTASSVSLVALSTTRIVTALRDSVDQLKLIVWDVRDNPNTLERRGDVTADRLISKVAAAKVSANQVVAAMRTGDGNLKVRQWNISENGATLTDEREVTAGPIQDLAAPVVSTFSGSANVVTPVITGAGHFKIIMWRQPKPDNGDDASLFYHLGDNKSGAADRLSLDTAEAAHFFSGVRTDGGNLKVTTWWAGSAGGNSLLILHGNCAVLYAHFKFGTMDPAVAYAGARVAAGQCLAQMGNSGRSSAPHCHIHAERVPSSLTVDDVLLLEASDSLPLLGFRPIPFHCAQAMWRTDVLPTITGIPNQFSTMSGHGVYFRQYFIRPTWLKEMYVDGQSSCPFPAGRKDCLPDGTGGPFPRINQALNASCWGHQLFIRGGSYDETVTFDRSMVVRSYDGVAVVGK